jgi:LCP family protein required for cell wall assembly
MKKVLKKIKPFFFGSKYRTIWTLVGLFILIAGAVGGGLLLRAQRTLNEITGNNTSIFDTARTLLPGTSVTLKNENGRTNILLLGMRGEGDVHGGLLTDSIMLLSIDSETNKTAMISFPRDIYTGIPGYTGKYKLNEAYSLGRKKSVKDGLESAKATVSQIAGVDVHYAVTVDFKAFTDIIDALDGVTVNVAEDFFDPNYEGGISVKAGPQDMDSDRALKYVWARLTTNDFDRSRRQREVINGVKDKLIGEGYVKKPAFLFGLLESLEQNIRTDMTPEEMKAMLALADKANLNTMIEKGYDTSPNGPFTSSTSAAGAYIIVPRSGNFTLVHADVQNIFEEGATSQGASQNIP